MEQMEPCKNRPLSFIKMEDIVKRMKAENGGIPVRSQKQFLTSIPSAFTGFDIIQWISNSMGLEDSAEAVNLANQLCHYGYFFPVSDWKNLVVKDDGSLYRFQAPYFWPFQNKMPDHVEYCIYLCKRTLRNKQKHGLEEYEMEALNSLKKNLAGRWDMIMHTAEEQLKLNKDRKKWEKIIYDSQERAYWRVHRPPPGYAGSMEPIPTKDCNWESFKKRRCSQDIRKELTFLRTCLNRTRLKVSVVIENLINYSETYAEYDPIFSLPQPANPWSSEDTTYWIINMPLVDGPNEKRVRKWALTMEDLVADPTGLQEFTNYLRKEYSHENIRFWLAAVDLRRSPQSQIANKAEDIYDEFLAPLAPCEVNIDSKTMEKTQNELKHPNRYAFDSAAEHIYTLLLKKDCYPRFIRSEHYKNLLTNGIQPSGKRKFDFFGFGNVQGKNAKPLQTMASISAGSVQKNNSPHSLISNHQHSVAEHTLAISNVAAISAKRRGSERSLTCSSNELSVAAAAVVHSHSSSNVSSRDPTLDSSFDEASDKCSPADDVCPWDIHEPPPKSKTGYPAVSSNEEIATNLRKESIALNSLASSEEAVEGSAVGIGEVMDRLRRNCNFHETFGKLGRRLSSSTNHSKQPLGNARQSVSSADDLQISQFRSFDLSSHAGGKKEKLSDNCTPQTRRKSSSKFLNRKYSTSTPPLISVSSVVDAADANSDSLRKSPCKSPSKSEGSISPNHVNTPNAAHSKVTSENKVEKAAQSKSKTSEFFPFPSLSNVDSHAKLETSNETKAINSNTASTSNTSAIENANKAINSRQSGGVSGNAENSTKPYKREVTEQICPWENEEKCKEKNTNYKKIYETYGYL